ncbi:MAG: hypothetical protein QG594_1515, partial [Bacteroidota bacterium]|nr:hypothetical protein [Bacteroidota bacterium]
MKLILILVLPFWLAAQTSLDKAQRLFENKNYNQAEVLYKELLAQSPNNLEAIEKLGDIAGLNKSWDAALDYYKKLKTLRPKEANYQFKYGAALGMVALNVNKFRALGMIDEIKKSFENAILFDDKHIQARWGLIELNLKLPAIAGGSQSKALKYANELQSFSAVDGYLAKGHIEEYFNRYTQAEAFYKKAILVGKSKYCYHKLASLYQNK